MENEEIKSKIHFLTVDDNNNPELEEIKKSVASLQHKYQEFKQENESLKKNLSVVSVSINILNYNI